MRIFRRQFGSTATPTIEASPPTPMQAGATPRPKATEVTTSRLASVVIAVTFQRLIEDAYQNFNLEEDLVLQALRRSTNALQNADAAMIADYLRGLSEDQLRGVASNVKGIYHELLFVEAENADWDEIEAHVMEFTNHPGGDVVFTIDGGVIGEVQLKAIASEAQVLEHLARYPEIDIRVTEEVADQMPGIKSSGFSNETLAADVRTRLSELEGEGFIDEVNDGLATSALVSAALIAGQVARGEKLSSSQMRNSLVDAGIGVATATVLDSILIPIVG